MAKYPPESSWNLPPTDEQIKSMNQAAKILNRDIREQDIPPTRWQMRRFLYDLWRDVRMKKNVKKSNPREEGSILKGLLPSLLVGTIIIVVGTLAVRIFALKE